MPIPIPIPPDIFFNEYCDCSSNFDDNFNEPCGYSSTKPTNIF